MLHPSLTDVAIAHPIEAILHIAEEEKRHIFLHRWIRHPKLIPRGRLAIGHCAIAIAQTVLQLLQTRHIIGGFATARFEDFPLCHHTHGVISAIGQEF